MCLLEVPVVLEAKGGQRQVVCEAAGGDPHVVRQLWSSGLLPGGGEPASSCGDGFIAEEHGDTGEPVSHFLPAASTPVPDFGPLGEFAIGDEGDHGPTADEPDAQRAGERALCRCEATSVSRTAGCMADLKRDHGGVRHR